jgi:hypothetical protein
MAMLRAATGGATGSTTTNSPQAPLSSGAVAEWLLDNGLPMTALELLHELPDAATVTARSSPAALHLLQRYFADVRRFPPAALAQCEQPDVSSHKALLKSRDEQISLLEYELRLAKEDLSELQGRAERLACESMGGAHAGCVPAPVLDGVVSDEVVQKGPGDIERRMLNFAVKQYLVARGYKLSALTFCEEVREACTLVRFKPAVASLPLLWVTLTHSLFPSPSTQATKREAVVAAGTR